MVQVNVHGAMPMKAPSGWCVWRTTAHVQVRTVPRSQQSQAAENIVILTLPSEDSKCLTDVPPGDVTYLCAECWLVPSILNQVAAPRRKKMATLPQGHTEDTRAHLLSEKQLTETEGTGAMKWKWYILCSLSPDVCPDISKTHPVHAGTMMPPLSNEASDGSDLLRHLL